MGEAGERLIDRDVLIDLDTMTGDGVRARTRDEWARFSDFLSTFCTATYGKKYAGLDKKVQSRLETQTRKKNVRKTRTKWGTTIKTRKQKHRGTRI